VRLTIRSADALDREQDFDSVIAGTGYEKDITRLAFLDSGIVGKIGKIEKAPMLSMNFESSVKGLYFIGPMSELSFGPIARFVAGAEFTARSLARYLDTQTSKRMLFVNIPRGAFNKAS
jgi:hypothetical protein